MEYVKVYKYLLRDLQTMNKAGHVYAAHGEFPVAPKGTFVSMVVDTQMVRKENFNEGTFRQAKAETE